jgi:hypothetical protein
LYKTAAKCGVYVITMLDYIRQGKCDAVTPEVLQVAQEGACIIRVIVFRTWDIGVGWTIGIGAIRAIGAINTDVAVTFMDCPLDGINHQAIDKIWEATG